MIHWREDSSRWERKFTVATPTRERKTVVSKVKDVDDKMFGPPFKTMKSEFVTWQEAIRAKKYDLYDKNQHDQPEGTFTERNMNRSRVPLYVSICGSSKGGYTTRTGTDWCNRMYLLGGITTVSRPVFLHSWKFVFFLVSLFLGGFFFLVF
jgi:hypothetical protein